MPFDSSDVYRIYFDEKWQCTTVVFVIGGMTCIYCSDQSHPGQGGE